MTTPDLAPTAALEPKTKLSGKILKTTLAGALVDIGLSVPGVIHISQLSKDSINKVEDVVKEGQTVEVWVRRVKKDRVELTMIEPLAYEWKELEPEMIVKGKVIRLEPYGAFIEIGAERPAMIHVSELTQGYVKSPSEIVKEGDEVEAKILLVDRRKKQIKLSMKALQPTLETLKVEREEKKSKRAPKKDAAETVEPSESKEPELTSMQVAWQEAMNKANAEKAFRIKREKSGVSTEQEDLLNRTLEQRLPTGG
ncbi:MAG: S1 RNA-binding domain-containing protein [Anaerolineales bacterium]|nr:S1 RNA-binding domain-containing protein [Anaerolineales bacterium]